MAIASRAGADEATTANLSSREERSLAMATAARLKAPPRQRSSPLTPRDHLDKSEGATGTVNETASVQLLNKKIEFTTK